MLVLNMKHKKSNDQDIMRLIIDGYLIGITDTVQPLSVPLNSVVNDLYEPTVAKSAPKNKSYKYYLWLMIIPMVFIIIVLSN
jgi:hypothetical protein